MQLLFGNGVVRLLIEHQDCFRFTVKGNQQSLSNNRNLAFLLIYGIKIWLSQFEEDGGTTVINSLSNEDVASADGAVLRYALNGRQVFADLVAKMRIFCIQKHLFILNL
jgi:hypothetical protein